jgi:hypothetical protein
MISGAIPMRRHCSMLSLRRWAVVLLATLVGQAHVSVLIAQTTPEAGATSTAGAGKSGAIRIRAGSTTGFKDPAGNEWLPDQGFVGGDVIERAGLEIENTENDELYRSERYSMESFSQEVPNGKYEVKLHFAETYEGISGEGQRVFSYTVNGKEFKDFDVWAKAGGAQKAYVETVPVDVTDGKISITFSFNVENPQINGIEIIPAS